MGDWSAVRQDGWPHVRVGTLRFRVSGSEWWSNLLNRGHWLKIACRLHGQLSSNNGTQSVVRK